jgi:Tfp pilus assembly protein PilF
MFSAASCPAILGLSNQQEDVSSQPVGAIEFDSLPVEQQIRSAVADAVKAREFGHAEELLVKELDRQPNSYALLAALGGIFFLDGKYLNCATALKKAERRAPLTLQDRYTLALAYVVLRKPNWARPEFEKLARSDSSNPLYVYWQGRIDYEGMQFKAAASDFNRALTLDPEFMKAYDNLGLALEALGDFDGALKNYHQATELNRRQSPPSPWPPLNQGACLIKLGKLAEAESSLRESLHYDSRFPMAHYQLGRLLEKENKNGEALQELRQAAANDPEYPDPHYAMGEIYQRTGDTQQAEIEWGIFQKLKQAHPHARVH